MKGNSHDQLAGLVHSQSRARAVRGEVANGARSRLSGVPDKGARIAGPRLGRRRQGSVFGSVEIIVPQVVLAYGGHSWSWDQGRLALIHYKQTLSDCAVDGQIPETVRIEPNTLLRHSREALDPWIA